MTEQEWNEAQANVDNSGIADDENPIFLFSGTSNALLGQLVRGEIDAKELAKRTLESRGYDEYGEWVGFNK